MDGPHEEVSIVFLDHFCFKPLAKFSLPFAAAVFLSPCPGTLAPSPSRYRALYDLGNRHPHTETHSGNRRGIFSNVCAGAFSKRVSWDNVESCTSVQRAAAGSMKQPLDFKWAEYAQRWIITIIPLFLNATHRWALEGGNQTAARTPTVIRSDALAYNESKSELSL